MRPRPLLFPHVVQAADADLSPQTVFPAARHVPFHEAKAPLPLAVDTVDSLAGFVALRAEWEALHAQDPEAGIFLGWSWFETVFAQNPRRWRVFVVREAGGAGRVCCILPTKYRVHWSKSQGIFQTEIEAAGRLNWGEYVGFVCDPAQEEAALTALARHMAALPWVRFSLRYESSARRADIFAAAFDPDRFSVRWKPYLINGGTTDNLKCPQIALPDDFETWIATGPSANTRQKLRRHQRAYIESGRYRVSVSAPDTLARDVDILLALWLAKWSDAKGVETARQVAQDYRRMLLDAQRLGALHFLMLWEGARPLAALGCVVDRELGRLHFLVAGRDEADPSPAIGLLVHAANIRWAIAQGLRVYDFGHGNEPYKYSFGSADIVLKYLEITRNSGATLDALSQGEVLRRLPSLLRSGGVEAAIRAIEAAAV